MDMAIGDSYASLLDWVLLPAVSGDTCPTCAQVGDGAVCHVKAQKRKGG